MAKPTQKKEAIKGARSVVLACSCAHSGQDAIYGKGNRLFNRGAKLICTVCGRTR